MANLKRQPICTKFLIANVSFWLLAISVKDEEN